MDETTFQRLVCTLLRTLGTSLLTEASTPQEESLGQMVIMQSRFISTVLRRSAFSEELSKQLSMDSLGSQGVMPMEEKLSRLRESLEAKQPEILEDHMKDETELEHGEGNELPFLSTVQDVQGFLLSSEAFSELQRLLQNSIGPTHGKNDYDHIWFILNILLGICCLIWGILQSIMHRFKALIRPVAPGHRRLVWKCVSDNLSEISLP